MPESKLQLQGKSFNGTQDKNSISLIDIFLFIRTRGKCCKVQFHFTNVFRISVLGCVSHSNDINRFSDGLEPPAI